MNPAPGTDTPPRQGLLEAHHLQKSFGKRQVVKDVSLSLRTGWADAFPQSAYLLREETLAWQKTPCILTLKDL